MRKLLLVLLLVSGPVFAAVYATLVSQVNTISKITSRPVVVCTYEIWEYRFERVFPGGECPIRVEAY